MELVEDLDETLINEYINEYIKLSKYLKIFLQYRSR